MSQVVPRSVRRIKGGVTVLDYRGTGLCPPNGSVPIHPALLVHHIPVVPNERGRGDIMLLGDVLRRQEPRLAVQACTDAEGKAALFTSVHELCYHARGANTISAGIEHMHMAVEEPWTEAQFRAAAVLSAWASLSVSPWGNGGVPLRSARLLPSGPDKLTRVQRTGHTTHAAQARLAGYNDRTDPGSGWEGPHVRDLARFFLQFGRF